MGSVVKNLSANAGDPGLIPGLGRSPGKGNGNSLQYSCLGNPMEPGGLQPMGTWDLCGAVTFPVPALLPQLGRDLEAYSLTVRAAV